MLYPFVQISYHQDKDDNQFYNYYYDFSDDSLFRINSKDKDQIVNNGASVNIPSGLTYIGYLFLIFLSRFFNQFKGNISVIVCMVLIDLLSIAWIYSKVTENRYSMMMRIKKESETVFLNKEEIIEMMKEPLMIEYYAQKAIAIILSFVLVAWSIRRFLVLGTLEFFFIVPLFFWILFKEMIYYRPANIYRMFKMLKDKKR